jgi:hypothetical protein
MSSIKNQPRIAPSPDVIIIARGGDKAEFEHSSVRWYGASYPVKVQMTERKDTSTAMPMGQSVEFLNDHKTSVVLPNLGVLTEAVGMTMKKTTSETPFITAPRAVSRVRNCVGREATAAFPNSRRQVRANICHCSILYSGL